MKLLITLDHELFFGSNTGTCHDCLINPANKLIAQLNQTNSKAVFFVDAGYLVALKRQMNEFDTLKQDYHDVVHQLKELDAGHHEIQFHFHPHWEDSFFDGMRWKIDISRYRPADFSTEDSFKLFNKYFAALQDICPSRIFAYRAGGWCIQPFSQIRAAMVETGISVDSTVFPGGFDKSVSHFFDFSNSPVRDIWQFSDDPLKEEAGGPFTELPISSHKVSPLFFQKMLFYKIFKKYKENTDRGTPVYASKKKILKKLFTSTNDVVSVDGMKSDLLLRSFKNHERKGKQYFVMIGHPKAFDERTYKNLDGLLNYALKKGHEVTTFRHLLK